ncbi:MAG: hypothetical protein FWD68_00460 [Alphaproteobacteria bacterium]|nr:hypothetical protein [Alphaproteobacteria bacterium]
MRSLPAIIDRLFRERLNRLTDPHAPGSGFDMIPLSASRTAVVVEEQRDPGGRRHDNDAFSALVP